MLPLRLYDQGILVVPVNAGKPIRPLIEKYEHWREKAPERSEYEAIWQKHAGAALLMMCENVEVVDLDTKNQEMFQDIIGDFERELETIAPGLLARLFIEQSPSGGMHYIYRTESPGVSFTAARRPSNSLDEGYPTKKYLTLCDYLAHGKMCRIAPSPGYTVLQGDILALPLITDEERRWIISAALSLNSYYENPSDGYTASDGGLRPGDDYNNRVDVSEMIDLAQTYGWRVLRHRGNYVDFNRPGAKNGRGLDATLNTAQRWWYPWTSSDNFGHTKAYTFYSMYAYMAHNGNFSAASSALRKAGYGSNLPQDQRSVSQPQQSVSRDMSQTGVQSASDVPDFKQVLERSRKLVLEPVDDHWVLWHRNYYAKDGRPTPIATRGSIVCFAGVAKSFKSQVVHSVAAAALGMEQNSGWIVDWNTDKRRIGIFDTEQGDWDFNQSIKRIHWMIDREPNPLLVDPFDTKMFSVKERLKLIEDYVVNTPALGLLIIDGYMDLVNNPNDPEEANAVMQFLVRMKSYGVIILGVIHLSETKPHKPLGHLGSYLMRKAEVLFEVTVENPLEEDFTLRRIKVRHRLARNEVARSFTLMSYGKMVYSPDRRLPEHFKKYSDGRIAVPAHLMLDGKMPTEADVPFRQDRVSVTILSADDLAELNAKELQTRQLPPTFTREEPVDWDEPVQLAERHGWVRDFTEAQKEDEDDALFNAWVEGNIGVSQDEPPPF